MINNKRIIFYRIVLKKKNNNPQPVIVPKQSLQPTVKLYATPLPTSTPTTNANIQTHMNKSNPVRAEFNEMRNKSNTYMILFFFFCIKT